MGHVKNTEASQKPALGHTHHILQLTDPGGGIALDWAEKIKLGHVS